LDEDADSKEAIRKLFRQGTCALCWLVHYVIFHTDLLSVKLSSLQKKVCLTHPTVWFLFIVTVLEWQKGQAIM
jgi:hypothetical protein